MFRNDTDGFPVVCCDITPISSRFPWCLNSEGPYLFGPGRFVAGIDRVLVVIELLLLGRPRFLLLLLLEGNQVRSLLLELPLKPLRLPLLLQLLPLILLHGNIRTLHYMFIQPLCEVDVDVLDRVLFYELLNKECGSHFVSLNRRFV